MVKAEFECVLKVLSDRCLHASSIHQRAALRIQRRIPSRILLVEIIAACRGNFFDFRSKVLI